MRTNVLILTILSFLTCSSVCFPSYVIELESGSELVADHHWEENGKIAFYFHGGVVAIPSHLVINIRESDAPPPQKDTSPGQTGRTEQVDEESASSFDRTRHRLPHGSVGEAGASLQAHRQNEDIPLEHFKEQRLLLKSELEDATKRFREASGSKDLKAKQEAIQDMTKISQKLYRLSKELEAKNKGVLPDWWD